MALLNAFLYDWLNSGSKGRHGLWLAALVVTGFVVPKSWAQAEAREYQLKAVFIFNFAEFVEWPPTAFPEENSPLVIGVLGDDPFGPVLDETLRGEEIGRRSMVVRRYRRVQDIDACHILYIGKSESSRLDSIIAALRGRNILTVCDAEGYAKRGVVIRFLTEKKKIRLRINLDAARLAGLNISSKLLRSAEIVRTDGD